MKQELDRPYLRTLTVNPGEKPLGSLYPDNFSETTPLTELMAPGRKAGARFTFWKVVSMIFRC